MKLKTEEAIRKIKDATADYEKNKPPQYCPWTPKFYCPISPEIPWYKGLVYKDCPVVSEQRDMMHCAECHLKGEYTFKLIKKAERKVKHKNGKNKKGD